MKKKKRINSKKRALNILAAVGFYGLTEKDLSNREKLDEALIRYQADSALMKKRGPGKKSGKEVELCV